MMIVQVMIAHKMG